MIIIIGKSGSGKTTLANVMCNKYDFNRILTTTTRPMRDGEIQDVDYHFVNEDEFLNLENNHSFIESQSYRVASGEIWYYGSPLSRIVSSSDRDVIILTPDGCKKVKKYCKEKSYTVIYLNPDMDVIRERLKARGDETSEVERRIKQDEIDFKDAEKLADIIIKNNNYSAEFLASAFAKIFH